MKTSAHLVPLKYFSLSIVFLLCLSTPLFAQEEGEIEKITQAEEFLFGEEMIVSAAKHEESLLRSPSAVTVIAAEELREYGIRDLVDALRLVPGLDVQAMSPSNTTVNIRRSAHIANWPVLFLIDGRKMTFDIMGFTIIETLPVSIEDIERIEVMRGPGSALYGAALSGIINIITKDPAKTNGFLLDAAGGNFNTRQITIRTAGGNEDTLRYRVTASTDATDSREENFRSKESSRATTRLLYDISPSQSLEFQAGFDKTSAGSASDMGVIGYDMFQPFAFLNWEIKKEDQALHAQVHYARMEGNFSIPVLELLKPILGDAASGTDFLNIPGNLDVYDVEIYYTPFTDLFHNRLTGGAQLRYANVRTPLVINGGAEETIAALYIQDEFSPIESLTILIGGRYDHNSVSKPSLSPRASIVFVPLRGHSFRASYGESFRKPSFFENQFEVPGLSDFEFFGMKFPISNPDLNNERDVTYELGYQWGHPRFRAFLDAFYTRMYDRFYFNYATFRFDNYSEVYSMYGGEIGSELAVIPDHVKLFVMYSLYEGDDTEVGMGPKFRSRKKLSAGAHLSPLRNFSLGCRIHAVDERHVGVVEPSLAGLLKSAQPQTTPSYLLLNINASYKILRPAIEIGVTAFNALDEDAYDYPRIHSATAGDYGGERLSRTIMVYLRGEF